MKKLTSLSQFMKKTIKQIFVLVIILHSIFQTIIFWLTWRYVDYGQAKQFIMEDVKQIEMFFDNFFQLKYIIVSAVLFLSLWGFYFIVMYIVKHTINETIKGIDNKYKNYSDAFSSYFIYDSIINKIVDEKIIKNMSEEELAEILHEGKFLIKDLDRFGFDKEVIKRVTRKYYEAKIKKLNNNEYNRDNKQVPD